jgi:hypothetical protein
VPTCSIHPSHINIFNEVVYENARPPRKKVEHLLKSDKKTHGIVSDQARRKITRAIDYLLYMANDKTLPDTAHGRNYKFKIAFITLTLPAKQMHSDNEIKDIILNHFLVELRKYYGVKNYIWRAEKQKNNNIHFHILVDKFIPWNDLRNRWNRVLSKLGYIDRYREEMKLFHKEGFKVRKDLLSHWDYQKQIRAYKEGVKNDWSNPNSTDIHSLYRINRVKEYITKYCTKNETNSEVEGRLWGCNYELSQIKGARIILDNQINSALNELIKEYQPRVYTKEYFTVIHIDINKLNNERYNILYQHFCSYLLHEFKFNTQLKLYLT